MTTLFDASLALAKILGNVGDSITTSAGTTTTLIDSLRTEAADYWNNGTLWITSGTYASNSRVVSDFASGTFTFSPALAGAPGSGKYYSYLSGTWPLYKLWDFINRALSEIGDVPQTDATLTTVAYQEEYTLPAGVANVILVEQAMSLTSPYLYRPVYGVWREREGKLVFNTRREPNVADYKLRLTYASPHAVLDADADEVSDYVHLNRLIWAAADSAWRWRVQMSKEHEPIYQALWAEAKINAVKFKAQHPIRFPTTTPRLPL